MAPVKHQIVEHDVVVFRDPIGSWPAGTTGAVVSDHGDAKLVEISDADGVALDFVQADAAQLDVSWHAPTSS